jgi:nucleoside-diphosphate-sugar epimerase
MPDALILGCGYLGRRVAARWIAAGKSVAALTRKNADALTALGIEPILGDVLDPASLRNVPRASTVLYAVGMDRSSGKTMHDVYVNGLRHVLDTISPPDWFIYVSSTGVYGQSDGGWVDEESPNEPAEDSGNVVLAAERLLREKLPGAIVLRFAGIYGPDRLLRKRAILNGEPLIGDAEKWLNLIHVEDGVEAVLAAEAKARPCETFLIADDFPVTRRDFYTLLAQLLNAKSAAFEHRPEPGAPNRRISNRKAREQLGWSPHYPSYHQGLPAAVRESTL